MITNLLEDQPIPIYGRGENIRDWLYVGDACQAIDQVLTKGKIGEAYNIGGESERSNIEVARQILSFLNKGEEYLRFVTDRPGHDLRYALSNDKIKKEIGWHPAVDFSEGLSRTVQWYQDQIRLVEAPQRKIASRKQRLLEQQVMKIMVTGYPGLLSMDLVPILREYHEVMPLSIDDLDITRKEEVFKTIETLQPEVVINCAGYTAVDQAENDWEGAFRANALGVHYLALACRQFEVILGHISTDYVFDGRISRPYQPWDIPNPISVYGASKQAGEFFIEQLLNRYYIIRTSSLYGKNGNNFVKTIIDKAEQGKPLSIVCDQVMSPTWSVNLSRGILQESWFR